MNLRKGLSVIGLAALLAAAALAAHVSLAPAPQAAAQGDESDQCMALVADALDAAQAACADVARGQACIGAPGVSVDGTGIETVSTDADATFTDLASLSTISTDPADPDAGAWGVAVLKLAADLPADSTESVTAILFGGAAMTRPSQDAAADTTSAGPTLTVSNGLNEPINLRGGAGTTYAMVAQVQPGETMTADGRNQAGDWVRVQYNGTTAWVFTRVISWDGDLTTLPVLAPDDVSSSAAVEEVSPFQVFALSGAASEACASADPGLLLQFTGEEPVSLVINGATVSFSDATLLVTASANGSLDVRVIGGSADVSAHGTTQNAPAGSAIAVSLAGEDGLNASGTPALQASYAFADVADAPLALLPSGMACVVGAPDGSTDIALRIGPGEQRGSITYMDPNRSYSALGWANDPDGAPWWELDTGDQTTWVAQSAVVTAGACAEVVEVEAPPMVFAAPSAPTGNDGELPMSNIEDLAPTGNSVWQMIPGSDNMSGDCSGAPAINFCDHLAAIQPAQGGIMWKGMEASPYYLQQLQANVYSYAGPNVIGTGTLSMTLTFTSADALKMTQTLTLASEPDCQHTYYYTGTRNW
ncbi:SH3 domain-containing protein [Aggregatilinea lenta]|uniref:SH3 domain-containing protein n=1 Tax=Aggregatilinea lenta TaxID=913108 RepID=UPI000E5C07F0|nr:SH3 domain-containing protein [Aggregatilinea lenta]